MSAATTPIGNFSFGSGSRSIVRQRPLVENRRRKFRLHGVELRARDARGEQDRFTFQNHARDLRHFGGRFARTENHFRKTGPAAAVNIHAREPKVDESGIVRHGVDC